MFQLFLMKINFSFNFFFRFTLQCEVSFKNINESDIQESEIPVNIIKTNENFFAEAICFYFNKSLENGKFANCLKLANITPVFKKGARKSKNNYRPVSILRFFQRFLKGYLGDIF